MGWRRTLDDLRADIESAEASAASNDFVVLPAFEPPADLGPLPAGLADEARDLSRRHDALYATLSVRRRPQGRAVTPRPVARSGARFEVRA